jgi:phosphoenolpyruvate synthase/pyruvate phosphate dikinase
MKSEVVCGIDFGTSNSAISIAQNNQISIVGSRIGDRKTMLSFSPMTTPDFLSAMKKASAIITDEGGIICHASIIAREMKKPCIIGTKIATKILKDGDLVEVDANKGLVKILRRTNK